MKNEGRRPLQMPANVYFMMVMAELECAELNLPVSWLEVE